MKQFMAEEAAKPNVAMMLPPGTIEMMRKIDPAMADQMEAQARAFDLAQKQNPLPSFESFE